MKRNLIALLFGIVGTGAVLAGWHLYEDHQNFHALLTWANQVVAAQAKAAQAAPK